MSNAQNIVRYALWFSKEKRSLPRNDNSTMLKILQLFKTMLWILHSFTIEINNYLINFMASLQICSLYFMFIIVIGHMGLSFFAIFKYSLGRNNILFWPNDHFIWMKHKFVQTNWYMHYA